MGAKWQWNLHLVIYKFETLILWIEFSENEVEKILFWNDLPSEDCQIIIKSFTRHHKIIQDQANGNMHYPFHPILDRLVVAINKGCDVSYPHSKMDESYYLSVQFPIAVIYSEEVWGALRAIETFSQLVYTDHNQVRLPSSVYGNCWIEIGWGGNLGLDFSKMWIQNWQKLNRS